MSKDYYEVLGISKIATQDQIKKAFRELALRYHPDVNKDKSAHDKFKEINEAYAVLSDPEKRKQYDTYGPTGFGQRFSEEDIFRGFNFEEIFKNFGINVDFSGLGGFNPGSFEDIFQQPEQTGVNFSVSFDDIEKGIDREYVIQRNKRCPNCKGSGGEPGSKQIKCSTCNGSGRRHIQQNSMFGKFEAITMCDRCGGKGKTYEKVCRTCSGNGIITVSEKVRLRVEKTGGDKPESDTRRRFGVF